MKKCLSILIIILLCAFLLVSCDELGTILGDLAGELISGGGDSYDYSTGGGGSVEKLSGTWTGATTEFNEDFALIDCTLTLTMDGEGNFTLSEVDASDVAVEQLAGTYSLDKMLLCLEISEPKTKTVRSNYIFLRTDETKYLIYEGSSPTELAEFSQYEDDNGEKIDVRAFFNEYTAEGTKLTTQKVDDLLGLTITDLSFEFDDLENPTTLTRSSKVANMATEDIALDITERVVVEELSMDEKPEEADMLMHYQEKTCLSEKQSLWYSYNSETDELVLYWSGVTIKLNRQ
ncbi:MAG: hypothetical protein ILP16_10145 [Spirochaetales bacterium]|nr:hypothetical protein [Spirochaetales bacterium]